MKTTLKKVLSMALALVLLVGVLPFQASATGNVTVYVNETAAQIAPGTYTFSDLATFCNTVLKGSTLDAVNYYHITADSNHTNGHSGATAGGFTASDNLSVNIHPELCVHLTVTPCAHTNSTAATCETPGTCNDCGFEVEPKLGHNMQQTADRREPTCGAAGSEAVMTCSNGCGKSTGGAVIPATGNHDFGNNGPVCLVCGGENENYVAPAVVTVYFYVDGEQKETYTHRDGEITIQDLINNCCTVDDSVTLEYVGAEINYEKANLDTKVLPGQTAAVYLKTQSTTPPTTSEPTTQQYMVYYNLNVNSSGKNELASFYEGTSMDVVLNSNTLKNAKHPGYFSNWYHLEGWYLDSNCTIKATGTVDRAGIVLYAKWARNYNYNVYLKIYTNGVSTNLVRIEDMFNYAQDQVITLDEVKSVVNAHIKSNNNAPLTSYGPFLPDDWELYLRDNHKLNIAEKVTVYNDRDTVLYVMVHNAQINGSTSSSGSKADSSNPKTGDMIMVPAAVMGTTVSALAVMFYLKKKRTV